MQEASSPYVSTMATASWNQQWRELQWEALVLQPAMRRAVTSTLPSCNLPSNMLRQGDTATSDHGGDSRSDQRDAR